jgi:uncharacterized membrane protein
MSGYRTDQNLAAAWVTKDLIKRIETAVDEWISATVATSEGKQTSRSTSIDDAFGRETFSTIDDLNLEGFPESTRAVIVERSASSSGVRAQVRVNLSVHALANAFRIILDGPRARQSADSLSNELLRLVRSHAPSDGRIRFATGLLAIALAIFLVLHIPSERGVLLVSNIVGATRFICGVAAMFVGIIMLVIAKGSSFESHKTRLTRDWQTWLVRLILGACVLVPAIEALIGLNQGQ